MAARKKAKDSLDVYQDLMRSFKQQAFKPLYLTYGTESYLPGRLQKHLIDLALDEHERDFNLDVVYGSDTDADAVLTICQLVPMMAERRVVIIRQFEKLTNSRRFAAYSKQPNPQTVLFLQYTGKPRFNTDPYRTIKKNAVSASFEPLKGRRVPAFVSKMATQKGCTLADGAAQTLVDTAGTSLATLANELDKLQTFVGERKLITHNDVVQASGQTSEINIFELQDSVGRLNRVTAHRICERLLLSASNARSECLRIVYSLSSYFLRFWRLHGYARERTPLSTIAKEIGTHPFIVTKQQNLLHKWPQGEVTRVLNALLSAETELKGGSQRSPRLIMTLLLNSVFIRSNERNIHHN